MKGSTIAISVLLICVLSYFLFPFAFIIPLVLVFGKSPPEQVRQAFMVFIAPVKYLNDKFEPYRQYLQLQERLLNRFL
ncbi:MAG TPA: hypothetical protein PKO06_18905 [Candidatus Ozemobacteraceae bacterium]|nr:hypothetical protein [Candidatus Ozemobacteraceae bacterium]